MEFLEFVGNASGLFLAGIAEDGKIWTADFNPGLSLGGFKWKRIYDQKY
jgi:hypothetical protein